MDKKPMSIAFCFTSCFKVIKPISSRVHERDLTLSLGFVFSQSARGRIVGCRELELQRACFQLF